MPWIVFCKHPGSPIEAIEVDESITCRAVESLVGTICWVPMEGVSHQDAIDSAIRGGFVPTFKDILPTPEGSQVTVKQLLTAKKAVKKYHDQWFSGREKAPPLA